MDLITTDETFVTKLQLQDKHLYIKLTWKQKENDLFHIRIFDEDCTWSGRFSNNFAQQFREKEYINENEEQYASNVKKCLLSGEDEYYSYEFKTSQDDRDTASFNWKRRLKGLSMVHGKVPVHRDLNPEPKTVLVDILLEENTDLKNVMKGLNTQITKLVSELDKSKQELEKYVTIKNSFETTLYGKFVQLLNAKKRRIQLLEDNLLNFEDPNNITMDNELD